MTASLLQPSLAAAGSGGGPCADLDPGDPTPSEVTTHLDETVSLSVCSDSTGDMDTDSCTWWVDETNGLGTVSPNTGASVTYTAPGELDSCIPTEFRLWVECTSPPTTSWADITVQCDNEDKDDVRDYTAGTSVEGGGCNSAPPVAGMFFMLAGVGSLTGRRRRNR